MKDQYETDSRKDALDDRQTPAYNIADDMSARPAGDPAPVDEGH
jgi:hypothetical protein